jgi:hypothetical protein
MDINTHVDSIVQNIISDITSKVQEQVATLINQKINEVISTLDTTSVLANQLSQKLDARLNQLPIDTKSIEAQLSSRLDLVYADISAKVQAQSATIITQAVSAQVNTIDFNAMCQSALVNAIQQQTFSYPDASIPGSAIDQGRLLISGNNVTGGIITNFGSTGIDDRAENCQLTIMDDVTVVENNLLTKDLTVKGTVTIEGDLNVTGTVPETSPLYVSIVNAATNNVRTSLDQVVFQNYADMVFDQIRTNGLDLTAITLNGQKIVENNTLANNVINSNLQKVGQLKELQVQGETFLSGTLYSTNQRVGINTIEPSQALSVWDQEVEIGISKQAPNVGMIGTPRNQALIISSNGKNNIVANPDGSVTINQLNIGNVILASSARPPSDTQPKGTIVFNENPTLGGPLGWVSLGNAKWANFGLVD